MGKEQFLQLLVAEMSNQDPLEPASGSDYVAQLAQFSSVEQLIQLNQSVGMQGSSLAQMVEGVTRMSDNQSSLVGASSLIGREVESTGGEGLLLGDDVPGFQVRLAEAATEGELVIRNNSGKVVRRIALKDLPEGENTLAWDGLTDKGEKAAEGLYVASVEAKNATGEKVEAEMFVRGTVSRVGMTKAGLTAWIGSLAVPISSLTSVASQ